MLYNVDFDIAASVFLLLLLIFHRIQYSTDSKCNGYFRMLIWSILLANLSDAFGCYTVSFPDSVPIWINYIINMTYYIVSPLMAYSMLGYMEAVLGEGKTSVRTRTINAVIMLIHAVTVLSTPVTHFIFYFDENSRYQRGYIANSLYVFIFYYLCFSFVLIFKSRKILTKKQFISLLGYIIIAESGTILQYTIFVKTMTQVAFFTAAIAAMILLFALETPDYQMLVKTMKDLEDAQKQTQDALNETKKAMALAEEQRQEAMKAKQFAEEADRAKTLFLANMSHEIRTPINGILGMDEIAMRENKDPAIEENLIDIRNAGEDLLSIINDILDFSKIESGKLELINGSYKCAGMIKSIKSMLDTRAREKNLELIVDINPNLPPYLFGDEMRIKQILINLLTNAVKYTHEGFVKLAMDYEEIDSDSIMLKIAVSDSGIGIKDVDNAGLFDAFTRADLGKNRTIEGTGLGLSITKNLVTMMNGSIKCESVYGKGSTFSVEIPQRIDTEAPEQIEAEKKTTVNDLYAPDAKILVVDDVAVNLKVVAGLLKPTAIQVYTAESGKKCLEMCEKEHYDIIFLDHMMPEMDGIETLNNLKNMKAFSDNPSPTIALTANAIVGAREEFIANGFTDYLSKPTKKELLYAMIKKYLEQ